MTRIVYAQGKRALSAQVKLPVSVLGGLSGGFVHVEIQLMAGGGTGGMGRYGHLCL